jgi:tryptophan halogenase
MKIIIVGGGTAGWLTTFLFRRYLPQDRYIVENVSSKEIPTVGVGESTTFRFIDSLQKVGLSFFDIYKNCDALPKLGINFVNWAKEGGNFIGPIDGSGSSQNLYDYFLYHCIENGLPIEDAGLGSYQSKNGKCNFFMNDDPSFLTDLDFTHFAACHIDTYSAGQYLKNVSLECGVIHHDDIVEHVITDSNEITGLSLKSGKQIDGDLFVDCTGFAKVIAKQLDGYKWNSYGKYLPLNAAIPFIVEDDDAEMMPYTNAITMSSGWVWEIASRNRIGRGYVFDSNFITDEQAVEELQKYYGKNITPIRKITFEAGSQSIVYNSNCVSIGLSASFLEPLEATNIHCTIVQIQNFITDCIFNDEREKYNNFCSKLFDNMRDFVAYHYTGGKENSEFWKHVKTLDRPQKVNEILDISKKRMFRFDDWESHDGQAGQPLWDFIAAGLGHIDKNCAIIHSDAAGYDKQDIANKFDSYHSWCKSMSDKCMTVKELNNYFKNTK